MMLLYRSTFVIKLKQLLQILYVHYTFNKTIFFVFFSLKTINDIDLHRATPHKNPIMDENLTNVTEMEVCFMIVINL